MKKLTALLLAALMLLSLCACAPGSDAADSGKVKIVTTIFPQYDFARSIAGDMAELTMLLAPGEETHTYDPSPADIITIQSCDIFIYGGGESDSWINDVLSSIDAADMTIISMMEVCELLHEEHVSEHEHGHDEHPYDEHVWTSPMNSVKIVGAICDALCAGDPDNQEAYHFNAKAYIDKLIDLDASFREIISDCAKDTLIFGDRFPLLYFVEEYGLEYCAAFPGCASNTEPSASTVAELIDRVKADDIPIVFKIEMSNGQTAETIAEAGGARVETFYTCHTISRDDFENGETYLSLMEKNLDLVKEALS